MLILNFHSPLDLLIGIFGPGVVVARPGPGAQWRPSLSPWPSARSWPCSCSLERFQPVQQVEALVPSSIKKAAFEGALWAPKISAKENPYVNKIHQLFFHYGPAHGVDLICRLVGRKPFLTRF